MLVAGRSDDGEKVLLREPVGMSVLSGAPQSIKAHPSLVDRPRPTPIPEAGTEEVGDGLGYNDDANGEWLREVQLRGATGTDGGDGGHRNEGVGGLPGQAQGLLAILGAIQRYEQGYRDAGGPEELLAHFVEEVMPCESNGPGYDINWTPPDHGYISAAQFHPGTWATARRIPDADPADPYEVGWAVGRWLILIGPSNAGTTSGWPTCYWRGIAW